MKTTIQIKYGFGEVEIYDFMILLLNSMIQCDNIAQGATFIAQMSNIVIENAELAKEKSNNLIKLVSKFKL